MIHEMKVNFSHNLLIKKIMNVVIISVLLYSLKYVETKESIKYVFLGFVVILNLKLKFTL